MSSHHRHDKHNHVKQYEYKVISSHELRKKDISSIDEYLNSFGSQNWDLVSIELKEHEGKGISFIGLMKRKTYLNHKDHSKHK